MQAQHDAEDSPLVSRFLSVAVGFIDGDDCFFFLHGIVAIGGHGENADHDVHDDGEGEAEDELEDELAHLDLVPQHYHGEEGT